MRRHAIAFATVVGLTVTLAFAPTALAIGRGGWDHVGTGATATTAPFNGTITALNADNPGVLYAGGNFTSAGGVASAKRIARWNGSHWSGVGSPALSNGQVFAIAYHAGRVYVGGTFQNAGGNADADFLAAWDGSSWTSPCISTVGGAPITGNVNALQILGNTLYVGGSFADGAGIQSADYLVACDLTTRTARSTVGSDGSMSGSIYALTGDSNGTLYAGGGFINLETIPEADHVAAYDGAWHAMGTGSGAPGSPAVDSFVRSLTAVGTDVYVGTDSVDVAGIAQADHVARWNGSFWSAVGADSAGTSGWFTTGTTIDALTHYGSLVIAAGSFQNANGVATADQIAYFDGTTWRPIGSDGAGNGPLPAHPTALAVSAGKIYVGGNFTSAGGDKLAAYLAAYALRQPDALIGATTAGHFIGNAVYSATGIGESLRVTIRRGHRGHAYVKIQNDGLVPASFSLNGDGGASGFVVHYYRGTTDITSAVRNGTYATASIAPRANTVIRIAVGVRLSSASTAIFTTIARSASGTPHDAVRYIVKAG
jgi:hypothetical protein